MLTRVIIHYIILWSLFYFHLFDLSTTMYIIFEAKVFKNIHITSILKGS